MNNSEDESALIESNIRLGKVLHPKFPRLKGTAIRVFSSFCIVIGILSILTQVSPQSNYVVRNEMITYYSVFQVFPILYRHWLNEEQ